MLSRGKHRKGPVNSHHITDNLSDNAVVFHRAILTCDRRAQQNSGMSATVGARAMVDHLAWAEGYRNRAALCRSSAKETSSVDFGNCYRLLADHYVHLADLEEDYARRSMAMRQAANQAMLST